MAARIEELWLLRKEIAGVALADGGSRAKPVQFRHHRVRLPATRAVTDRSDNPAYRLAYDKRIRDAQRQLHRHPGYVLFQEQRTHQRMLRAVFQPNLAALTSC